MSYNNNNHSRQINTIEDPHSPQVKLQVLDVTSYKDTVYWAKRAVEMEKLLRSLKECKILLDQARNEIIERKRNVEEKEMENSLQSTVKLKKFREYNKKEERALRQ